MPYFDMSRGTYVRTEQKNARPIIKSVEYATKEELKEEVILAQNARSKMTTKIGQHEEYIEDLYHRHDTMRNDLNDTMQYVNYLHQRINDREEAAPKASKRHRRVTIIQG